MKIQIQYQYRPKRTKKTTFFSSEFIPIAEALHVAKDLEGSGRAENIAFYDETGMEWLKKELEKYTKKIETEPHNVTVYFDGGFDREERLAGLGVAIYFEQDGQSYRIRKNDCFEQIENNNEAEYAAFWLGLLELELLGVQHQEVLFKGDSQVVINHLSGDWPCYEEDLQRWIDRIEEKIKNLGLKPNYELIGRNANKEADQLAGQALKDVSISSKIQID
ncbi:reverse transcriptase-like protein [Anaerobacillus sp. MEB173]|uniref:reverse transcriptase-like protein n=1 Tax=Anaerobacillus sp. MEB173 TaxID=3383345 RepID=UPI003F8DC526